MTWKCWTIVATIGLPYRMGNRGFFDYMRAAVLIQKKFLNVDARNDRNAVRAALYAHLDETLG